MCSGCGSSCGACKAVGVVMLILVTVLTLAAAIGLYMVHVTPAGLVFGTTEGSLSIMALLFCLISWKKICKGVCGCCGKGCGGKCAGKEGMCPGCGHNPCTCK
jgi:hypothetical protein